MTTEEKAKAWDEAIERAKSKIRNDKDHVLYEEDILDIFPSLKESDEERIRKYILSHFQEHLNKTREFISAGMTAPFSSEEIKMLEASVAWLEKKGEQKSADKVLPKFKVGDWVICKNGSHRVFQVIKRSWPNAEYLDEKGAGGLLNVATLDKQYRPWTIQDAKAGDLLADDYGIYIFDRFFEYDEKSFYCKGAYQRSQKVFENEHMLCSVEVHPATKEQRDLLFQKMKEAGYEWDVEKKELKMIEQKSQSTWKPSDEQMEAVKEAACYSSVFSEKTIDNLISLSKQLKKLREK